MTGLLHFTFPKILKTEGFRDHSVVNVWTVMPQFYGMNKIEPISRPNISIKMDDIVDARTLRRLNRLKKREMNMNVSTKAKAAKAPPPPFEFVDMPWYQMNLNALLDGSSVYITKNEPLYVCKSCYEYNTAYSTDFVPVEDVQDSKSAHTSCTNVSSLKDYEIEAIKLECVDTDTPDNLPGDCEVTAELVLDVSGALVVPVSAVDVSGSLVVDAPVVVPVTLPLPIFDLSGALAVPAPTAVDISGTCVEDIPEEKPALKINSVNETSCTACCTIA
jgi:hypothetical protein